MKKRSLTGILCFVMILSIILACTSCGGDKGGAVETKVIDMTLEEAKAKITEAGGTPVVADVYDAAKEDGALLSIGDFASDVKEGDYVTIFRNDLGIKDAVTAMPVAPMVIEQSSYEDKIYSKISEDKTLKMTFDTYYLLITPESADETQKNTYPILSDMSIYVLDTSASPNEIAKLAGYIAENTEYTAEDMFNDYVKVGIVPTPCAEMEATLVDASALVTSEVEGGLAITNYKGSAQNIVVPGEIDGKTVVDVAKGAFPQSTLHAVTLLDGPSTLYSGAFSAAYGITNIYLPDSVSSVQENTFPVALFTEEDENGIVYLGSEKDLAIKYAGDAAELTVPDGVRFIGGAFASHHKTLTSVTLPEGLLSIGVESFRQCDVLTKYNIPSTVTRICEGAFRTTRHLTEIIIPDSVTSIDDYAFFETNDVLSITIGSNVKTIGYEAFDYNLLVTEVHIPDSVEYIGENAFLKCLVLANVTGGKNVSYVGANAFVQDPWYNNLCINSGSDFGYLNTEAEKKVLILYDGRDAEVTLPDDVYCLSSAFTSCASVKKIVVNDGCTMITKDAFSDCAVLRDVYIPASVTTIEDGAFSNITDKVTIHCEAGSAAEEYAKKNLLQYDNNLE